MTTASISAISTVMQSVLDGISDTNSQAFKYLANDPIIKTAVERVSAGDVDGFHFSLGYSFEQFVDGLLQSQLGNNQAAKFLFLRAGFIEAQFTALIEAHDGFTCCADKSNFLISGLANFFMTGKEIEFDRTQKYTYHLPVKVLSSHAEVVEFFLAVRLLYCGDSQKFVEVVMRQRA